MTMEFTFIVRVNAEAYEGRVMDFPNADAAIEAAPTVLQATLDYRPLAAEPAVFAAIGVGQGSLVGAGEVTWLGEWEWRDGQDWCWTASPRPA